MLSSNTEVQFGNNAKRTWRNLFEYELFGGLFKCSNIWMTLGWLDIKQRYRRSVLGPFWLTISTIIMVVALGLVYSVLFQQPLQEYFPYLAVGLISWTLISTIALESCEVFTAAEGMIKQVRLPFTVHVMRMVWRNVIIFFHNVVVLVAAILFFVKSANLSLLTVPLAIIMIMINGLALGVILGVFCTRFRDISPMVANVVQLTFFITPIFWKAEALVDRAWLVEYNPAYHFINLIRSPVLSGETAFVSWGVVAAITLMLSVFALLVLKKFRSRIAYWV